MESLYRKYRPLTFESVVGQQHIVSTLEHAVSEGRLGHAYLFCGPRGTGKTTMARILSKALLCEGAEAARATGASGCMACGSCPECEAIAAGTHPDVYELDAASRTGVDNVREEIINSVNFAPVRGAYKVYIVDEVHMLTTQAFNALLKTLEEPPSHVVFVLCTTDPQKLPETILSRCQRFDFHRISNEDIVGRMRFICEQEGFSYDDEALEIVARHARGGMRDALSTLEQLSVFGNGSVAADDARSLLGEVASTVLAEFARAIAKRDVVGLFGLIRTQVEDGNDLMELTRDLVAHLRDVYAARLVGGASGVIDGTPDEVEELVAEAGLFESADRVARTLTALDDAALEMRNASDTRLVLEVACTRLARPEADLTLEALAERLARLEAQVASGVAAAPMASVPGAAPAAGAGVAPAAMTGRGPAVAAGRPAGAAPARNAAGPAAPTSRGTGPAAASQSASASGALPWERGPHATPVPQAASTPRPRAAASPAPVAGTPQPPADASAMAGGMQVAAPAAGAPRASVASPAATSGPAAAASVQRGRVAATTSSPAVGGGAGASASAPAAKDAGELQRRWDAVAKRVSAQKANAAGLLFHARATSDDGTVLTVTLPPKSDFAYKMLAREDIRALLVPAVNEEFGTRTLEIVMQGAAPAPAPTAKAAADPAPVARAAVGAVPAVERVADQAPIAPGSGAPAASGSVAPASPAAPGSATPASAAAPEPAAPAAPGPAAPASSAASGSVAPAKASPEAAVPNSASGSAASSGVPAPAVSAGEDTSASAASAGDAAPAAIADHTSGPTVVPEPDIDAQRRAWEDEQVPYDDATIAAYEVDSEVPPVSVPDAPTSAASGERPAVGSDSAAGSMSPPQSTATPNPAPAAAPGALPWSSFTPVAEDVPQNQDEAKEMINNIFGSGVVFKPTE